MTIAIYENSSTREVCSEDRDYDGAFTAGVNQWLPCPLTGWNLLFSMVIWLNSGK